MSHCFGITYTNLLLTSIGLIWQFSYKLERILSKIEEEINALYSWIKVFHNRYIVAYKNTFCLHWDLLIGIIAHEWVSDNRKIFVIPLN